MSRRKPPPRAKKKRSREILEFIETARRMQIEAQIAYLDAFNSIEQSKQLREKLAIQRDQLKRQIRGKMSRI